VATELALRFRGARLRVIFQHAPVWEASSSSEEEGTTGPPDGLQLYRVLVSREDSYAMPTPTNQPEFFRPVPPFQWHKEWAGTSWTWGIEAGGWDIPSLSDDDDWHGSAPPEAWNLRLPGGIFVQAAPKIIPAASVGRCRIAWLVPGANVGDPQQLLRLEAGVQVLQAIVVQDDEVMGFAPPTLTTYRCDVLQEVGELKDAPSFVQMMREEEAEAAAAAEKEATTQNVDHGVDTAARPVTAVKRRKTNIDNDDSGLSAVRDALKL
jgi:hypothetical protein